MDQIDPREVIQKEAKDAWLNSNMRNTLIVPTGVGKSKIAIDIIKQLNPSTVLLLTNSTQLRDTNWKEEFKKFGMGQYYDSNVVSLTYQGAHRHQDYLGEWAMIIMDEIDFACTPGYSKCFEIQGKMVLGLTGYCTEDKKQLLNHHFPICFESKTQEVQELGLINKSEFIIVQYPLSKSKTISQKTKTKRTFLVSENDQYCYYNKEYKKAIIQRETLETKYKLIGVPPETQKDWAAANWKFIMNATRRKTLLHNLESSSIVTKNLINKIHSSPGNKVLTFSALTKQADKLGIDSYHAKNKDTSPGLDALNTGAINSLAVVKAINRGVNLVGVNYLIKESYNGSDTDFVQTHGRGLRLNPDQVMKMIILVPYYEEYVKNSQGVLTLCTKPTQCESWMKEMTEAFSIKEGENMKIIKLNHNLEITNDHII